MCSQKLHSVSIPGTNTEQGFSDSYDIKIQLITETTERDGEFQTITVYRDEDREFTDFVIEVQKKKMKELWDNEEDSVWDNV